MEEEGQDIVAYSLDEVFGQFFHAGANVLKRPTAPFLHLCLFS